jgi:hypothetical protein
MQKWEFLEELHDFGYEEHPATESAEWSGSQAANVR